MGMGGGFLALEDIAWGQVPGTLTSLSGRWSQSAFGIHSSHTARGPTGTSTSCPPPPAGDGSLVRQVLPGYRGTKQGRYMQRSTCSPTSCAGLCALGGLQLRSGDKSLFLRSGILVAFPFRLQRVSHSQGSGRPRVPCLEDDELPSAWLFFSLSQTTPPLQAESGFSSLKWK